MTTKQATQVLSTLRPDNPVVIGVIRARYGWVALAAEGGHYCLVTGRYTCAPQTQEERFGGDEQ